MSGNLPLGLIPLQEVYASETQSFPTEKQKERLKELLELADNPDHVNTDSGEPEDYRLPLWKAYADARVVCHFHIILVTVREAETCYLWTDFQAIRGRRGSYLIGEMPSTAPPLLVSPPNLREITFSPAKLRRRRTWQEPRGSLPRSPAPSPRSISLPAGAVALQPLRLNGFLVFGNARLVFTPWGAREESRCGKIEVCGQDVPGVVVACVALVKRTALAP